MTFDGAIDRAMSPMIAFNVAFVGVVTLASVAFVPIWTYAVKCQGSVDTCSHRVAVVDSEDALVHATDFVGIHIESVFATAHEAANRVDAYFLAIIVGADAFVDVVTHMTVATIDESGPVTFACVAAAVVVTVGMFVTDMSVAGAFVNVDTDCVVGFVVFISGMAVAIVRAHGV